MENNMAVICNKLKSGECIMDYDDCMHARLHEHMEKSSYGTGCLNPHCGESSDVQCVAITETETYALRLLYGIRIQ